MPSTARHTPSPSPAHYTTTRAPKPTLNDSEMDHRSNNINPQQWLNFSLPPRQRTVPGSGGMSGGVSGVPRRSRRGDSWRGSALTREKYVNANFRFVLKPTMTGSYGAHFADPDMWVSLRSSWTYLMQSLISSHLCSPIRSAINFLLFFMGEAC